MSYYALGSAIEKVVLWLNSNGVAYALVGGLAVSFRASERATKDIDLALATKSDLESEQVIRAFQTLGFHPTILLENKTKKIISTVRLISDEYPGVYLDLLFAASGIEQEVVTSADLVEILPSLSVRLASRSALIAMKVLSSTSKHRKQDVIDLDNLCVAATTEEIVEAKRLVSLIEARGFSQGRDLTVLLTKVLNELDQSLDE